MKFLSLVLTIFCLSLSAHAQDLGQAPADDQEVDLLDELDPFDPNVEETLRTYDQWYEEGTGLSSHLDDEQGVFTVGGCYRASCAVWARVVKSQQRMFLYVNGSLVDSFPVSTGVAGRSTPNFDKHPDGRIYDKYTSNKFPGGDYKGLGNMPYAVFIAGGFAIHGTPQGNWPKLGRRASHGCIRVHPDNGFRFNRLVRANGIRNVWITVEN